MPIYPKVDQYTDYAETLGGFMHAHKAKKFGGLLVARANVSVPMLTRLDGSGPNAIITGSGGDPELERIIDNKRMRTSAMATVVHN
jgi:hypothetical protein